MAFPRGWKIAAIVAGSFAGFVVLVGVVHANGLVSQAHATLMLVALVGLYVGFGTLIAVYRLVVRLDEFEGSRRASKKKKPPA